MVTVKSPPFVTVHGPFAAETELPDVVWWRPLNTHPGIVHGWERAKVLGSPAAGLVTLQMDAEFPIEGVRTVTYALADIAWREAYPETPTT